MGAGASTEGIVICAEGDRVKGNYKGKGKWHPGHVTKVNDNGTYEITYDDGDHEKEVRAMHIRSHVDSASTLLSRNVPSPKKKSGSPKKKGRAGADGLNIPPQLIPRLHRFWALMVQGLQCKAWRIEGSEANIETLGNCEETNEVLWLLAQNEPMLAVGPQKTQKPNSGMILFPLNTLHTPTRVDDNISAHPVFQLQNGTDTVVIGVDTEKSANMLVQLIGEVLDGLSGKTLPQQLPPASPETNQNTSPDAKNTNLTPRGPN